MIPIEELKLDKRITDYQLKEASRFLINSEGIVTHYRIDHNKSLVLINIPHGPEYYI
jgi:hypothetical protein